MFLHLILRKFSCILLSHITYSTPLTRLQQTHMVFSETSWPNAAENFRGREAKFSCSHNATLNESMDRRKITSDRKCALVSMKGIYAAFD